MNDGTPVSGEAEPPEPPRLRQLRWLVNTLMLVLIGGILVIAGALVMRLNAPAPRPLPQLPAALSLPQGESARAVTFGDGWVAVVTADPAGIEHIRVFDAATGAARASIALAPRRAPPRPASSLLLRPETWRAVLGVRGRRAPRRRARTRARPA